MTDTLLDSHCHAWERWPYLPRVPDEATRGSVDLLLHEMDVHGVELAIIVAAAIESNADNLGYVAAARDRHPDRFLLVADLDCPWSATYHAPGSPDRLRALDDRYGLTGFAHYTRADNDGWLLSDEAAEVFAVAAERGLLVSLGVSSVWHADLRVLAARHPTVPVLCQALGGIRTADGRGVDEVLASAAVGNIHVKVAGLSYAAERDWDYPWPDALAALERIHAAYGAARLCWGSDFPASTRFTTFKQSIEVVTGHCAFLGERDLELVMGGTLRRLLA